LIKFFISFLAISFILSSEVLSELELYYDTEDYLTAQQFLIDNTFENEDFYYLGYLISYKLDDLNKANEYLQLLFKIDEDDDERYSLAADHLSELINDLKNSNKTLTSGFINESIAELTKLVDKYKNNAIIYFRLGHAYKANEDYDNAAINFKKAVELNPYKSDYKNEIIALANIEILKGKEFYDMKEYQDALIHFNKAIEYDPENSSAMFRVGNIYFAIRDYVLAAEFLEKGLQYQNNNYKVLYMLGRCYSALSENDKAIEAYNMALEFNPSYTKASFEIARIYKNMGDFDTSRNMLNDIIAISNDSKSYELLLDIEIQTNKLSKALEIGENGLSFNPDSYTLLSRMAGLYNELGEYEKAKTSAKNSMKIKRNYAPAAFELGIAEISLCNKVAAKEAFNKAKRDRNYRKAASSYLKPENFEHYSSHCN